MGGGTSRSSGRLARSQVQKMRKLIEFLEYFKSGFITLKNKEGCAANEFSKKVQNYKNQIRPFVFSSISSSSEDDTFFGDDISLPFPIVSVEISGDQPFIYLIKGLIQKGYDASSLIAPYEPISQPLKVNGIIAEELSPKKFLFWLYGKNHEDDYFLTCLYCGPGQQPSDTFKKIQSAFASLSKKHLASEKVNYQIGLRTPSGKHSVRIREVIHVTDKKILTPRGPYGGPISHTHRWEVGGHWRTISGVGKDRQGSYGMNGATWVIPHVKGPECKPLIKKQRVVHRTGGPVA